MLWPTKGRGMSDNRCSSCNAVIDDEAFCEVCGEATTFLKPVRDNPVASDGTSNVSNSDSARTATSPTSRSVRGPLIAGLATVLTLGGGFVLFQLSSSSDSAEVASAPTTSTSAPTPAHATTRAAPIATVVCTGEPYAQIVAENVNNWQVCSTPSWSPEFARAAAERVTGPGEYTGVISPVTQKSYRFTCAATQNTAAGLLLTCGGGTVVDFPENAESPVSRLYLAQR